MKIDIESPTHTPHPTDFECSTGFVSESVLDFILDILSNLNPDICYIDRLRVGAVLFNESNGSEFGLAIWDDWCRRGSKYWGEEITVYKWNTFSLRHPRPAKLPTLVKIYNECKEQNCA